MNRQKRCMRILVAVAGMLFGGAGPLLAAVPQHFTGVHVAQEMIFVYGNAVSATGAAAQPGDEVAVFTQAGILCGAVCIATPGKYPAIAVYRDDPMTQAKDGALAGEKLRFRLWDASATREYSGGEIRLTVVERQNADGDPYWSANLDASRVDLVTDDAAATWVTLTMTPGWNLLSLPFDTAPGNGPLTVLTSNTGASLIQCAVWTWDSENQQFVELRDHFTAKQGFWAFCSAINSVQTKAIAGKVGDEIITLQPGWNLVGPVADTPLATIAGVENVAGIWGWNSGQGIYDWVPQDGVLQAGKSYWVQYLGTAPCELHPGE